MVTCECAESHERRRVVLTGGPGAGKTAVLELIRQSFCEHVRVLPEAAGIVFGGGFPREDDLVCTRAAQRAIFYVQCELENAADGHRPAIVLCDRGTLDSLAYWPGPIGEFWSSLGTTQDEQLARYDAVIHLRTPALEHGYNHQNPLRTESATAAAEIDARILQVWQLHPRRFTGLGSLLLFAALFYFMMRFGCGAHMVHGHGGGGRGEHGGHERGSNDRDPVCGMDVAPGQGYVKMYGGRDYRLCSRACLDKFEEHPHQYASVAGGAR